MAALGDSELRQLALQEAVAASKFVGEEPIQIAAKFYAFLKGDPVWGKINEGPPRSIQSEMYAALLSTRTRSGVSYQTAGDLVNELLRRGYQITPVSE